MVSQSRTNIKNHFHAAKTEVSHAWRGAIEEADNSGPFKKVSEGLPFPEPPATGTECQRESGQTSFRRGYSFSWTMWWGEHPHKSGCFSQVWQE